MTEHGFLVPPSRRLLAFSGYLGLAPWLGVFRAFRQEPFLRHHRAQALSVLLLLAPLFLLGLAGLLILTDLVVSQAFLFDLDMTLPVVYAFFTGLGILAAGWGLIWLIAIGMALAGSLRRAPLVRGERRPWVQGLALAWSGFFGLLIVALVALGLHATRLARSSGGPAPVYLLFDPRGFEVVGTWGPKMAFYPVAREARARWGEGSTVVAPLSPNSFRQVLRHGRLVVLLVHGREGTIVSRNLIVSLPRGKPRSGRFLDLTVERTGKTERVQAGKELQVLYNTGCRIGVRGYAWAWQQRLAPTEVITFDRFSGGLEHLWWIWIEAPRRLRTIR